MTPTPSYRLAAVVLSLLALTGCAPGSQSSTSPTPVRTTPETTARVSVRPLVARPSPAKAVPTHAVSTRAATKAATSPTKAVPRTAALDRHFDTCKEVIDAGYGPYYRGKDPEYSWYTDRDGDGIACES